MALALLRSMVEALFGNDVARANVAAELADLEARFLEIERVIAQLGKTAATRPPTAA